MFNFPKVPRAAFANFLVSKYFMLLAILLIAWLMGFFSANIDNHEGNVVEVSLLGKDLPGSKLAEEELLNILTANGHWQAELEQASAPVVDNSLKALSRKLTLVGISSDISGKKQALLYVGSPEFKAYVYDDVFFEEDGRLRVTEFQAIGPEIEILEISKSSLRMSAQGEILTKSLF